MIHEWKVIDTERLDNLLRREIPLDLKSIEEISNSKIRRLIMANCIKVNGTVCRNPSFILRKGFLVTADIQEDKFFYEKKPDDIEYSLTDKDVLFEDDSIIVVNKPAFLPTEETIVKSRGNMHQAVVDYLWKKNPSLRNPPYAGIMHRLDRETSGVLLFTKTRAVNNAVHAMFESHDICKIYRAVCTCKSQRNESRKYHKDDTFIVENFIGRISPKSSACKIGTLPESKGGQWSHSDFRVVGEVSNLYYIDCSLLTGRTHQIRVHLSSIGLPLVGDDLYGGSKGFDFNKGRIMLHAKTLKFNHPVTGESIEVHAPLPDGFGPESD